LEPKLLGPRIDLPIRKYDKLFEDVASWIIEEASVPTIAYLLLLVS
jgi:hypothetical protein